MLQLMKYVSKGKNAELHKTHFDVKLLTTPVDVPYCFASAKIQAIPGENKWSIPSDCNGY